MKTLDATAAQSWCLVRIATQPFAVALGAVAEIVEVEELVRLPLCSPWVLGLCAYRRDLLPVVALGRETAATTDQGRPVVLIVRSEQGTWGIQIDRGGASVAEGPLNERGRLSPTPDGAVIIGAITRGDAIHSAIDTEATWRNIRDAIERWYQGDRGQDRRHGA